MNLNKVFVAGRLTADPELRTTPGGAHVISFSVATNRVWTDRNNQRKEETEFHNIVAWGRQAEVVSQFLKKGSLILIEGRLQTRSWEGKDGQTRRTTEIVAERVQLGPKTGGAPPVKSEGVDETKKEEMPVIDLDSENINPEDLPF
ncbi:MAG: single-stranded DNA-binding protein [Candidatus Colwellbacteria bacterium]|nr:single-stranded DNA-binding protein [Candidatus Colwellbacteria bacterium]